ncbi:hypothetical protein EMIHUDRAFT_197208 [Emiliania huxleyi CCMP1516]|uniref:Uncharacterized protein n=2 Tax=Emiliania huxleyi TaxID=2903 RepID=A0A0D3ITW0_EMIH1|nr:hypothetical protein EMIHUDRAFT_197208 [Emiliania huxleyi CCMP1516]EOD14695.1 hypothetical protein EMIHUDRAFT_197208 [Emiliania huxleyi CCMP1516]|eukprot:XP_005767124.1 hypothetical protein EMIHUDRAFT_197208 [Emiliania huxleyi CCMP1516]
MHWASTHRGVASRFRLIESHWTFFVGYGGVLAALSAGLRFWDLFVLRAACFGVINSALQLAELRMRPSRS